jgi:hypothetical protein
MFGSKVILPNGPQYMSETPAPRDPGPDGTPPGTPPGPGDYPFPGAPGWRLVPQRPDWPDWLTDPYAAAQDEDPGDLEEYEDPDNAPPPGLDDAELAALLAEAHEITAEQARAADSWARLGQTGVVAAVGAVCAGRRGPGMPGSAESFPGEYAGPAAGFASGMPLDAAPCWGPSWRTRPGPRTGTPAPPTMSWPG